MPQRIWILDTTLRDGEQTPGVSLNIGEKLEIARQIERLGVDWIEAGFPAVSSGEFKAVQAIAGQMRSAGVAALCRAVPGDIDTAWSALASCRQPRLHVFIATSPLHMQYKLRMTPQQVLERVKQSISHAKKYCSDVQFSAEDASRSDPVFLAQVVQAAIQAGANCINLPDTVGYCIPEEYAALISQILHTVPDIDRAVVSVHCHDDLGLSVANTLAAVSAGARQVEGTINGIGERAGNAALEEILMALATRKDDMDFFTGADTRQLYHTSRIVSSLTGVEIPPTKAIVGSNAFKHESGIHQHGMMAHSGTYQIMTPEDIGVPQSAMVLGKHSGRHAFQQRLEELGYTLSAEQLETAFAKFKDLADRKKDITDRDLEAVVELKLIEQRMFYQIDSFMLQSGDKIGSSATVTLSFRGELFTQSAIGDGPVDAIFQAINQLVALPIELDAYSIRAVTQGADALGEVMARIRCRDELFVGRGLSTDIIQASAHAYINAINRAMSHLEQEEGL